MKIRHFIYADVEGINSLYGQLFQNIKCINYSTIIQTQSSAKAEISLPSILKGFIGSNVTGQTANDNKSGTSYDVEIPLEKKIDMIISKALGSENSPIDLNIDSNEALMIGYTIAVTPEHLEKLINSELQSNRIDSLDVLFMPSTPDNRFRNIWNTICDNHKDELIGWHDNGLSILDLMYDPYHNPYKDEQLIVLNSSYPIFLFFSYGKVLFSHSELRSSVFFAGSAEQNVLGYLYKKNSRLYTFKPLSMWRIIDGI